MKNIHGLKTWPEYFEEIINGNKTFEVRRMDRNFKPGDILDLQEWNPQAGTYTHRNIRLEITYVLEGGQFGIDKGFCVIGFKAPEPLQTIKSKEEVLDSYEPNREYPSYYHESNVLDAMQTYASQFPTGFSREQMQGYVRFYLDNHGDDITISNETILDNYLNSLTSK